VFYTTFYKRHAYIAYISMCMGALHVLGTRCAHLPLASGVLNALTMLPRCAPSSQYIAIGASTATPDKRSCLDFDENKRNREYYKNMTSFLKMEYYMNITK